LDSVDLQIRCAQDQLVKEEAQLAELIKEHSKQIAVMQEKIMKARAEEESASGTRKVLHSATACWLPGPGGGPW